MRILVVSDTHNDAWALRQAIAQQPTAEVVVHLGDGAMEAAQAQQMYPARSFCLVRGNCDWGSDLPAVEKRSFAGVPFFITHGYAYHVKYGLYEVRQAARAAKAKVLLFGHTHDPLSTYEDGLYILNPGSCHGAQGTYGFVDISPAGIVTQVLGLR